MVINCGIYLFATLKLKYLYPLKTLAVREKKYKNI